MSNWQIWIDTGGTFTDCLAIDPTGKLHRTKVLSSSILKGSIKTLSGNKATIAHSWGVEEDIFNGYTLRIPAKNFASQVTAFAGNEIILKDEIPGDLEGSDFELTAHEEAPLLAARLVTRTPLDQKLPEMQMRLGTTKGTNALLEEKGDPPLLITTKGFKDLPLIGHQQRPHLFSLNIHKANPLHKAAYEVSERIDHQGKVLKELVDEDLQKLLKYCRKEKISNAAVALLNSYQNAEHEQAVAKKLREAGVEYITQSAELTNQIKFFERTETALVNAYLLPVLNEYLESIRKEIGRLKIMTSSGGLVSDRSFNPKDSLFSGPAGGVVAASYISRQTGIDKIITFDMGGTSTDVARYAGRFDYQYETSIGQAHISGPSLFLHTVAAGGGSVCGFDGEKFSVGPESGGADPGPASYGAGGQLCITDVNLLLGKMATDRFAIPLDRETAQNVARELLGQVDQPQEKILQGFLDIANEKMADAIRKISVSKGYDPKDYAMLAFGGAGGMHACKVASLLDMKKVILPRDAGILSAYGIGNALEERFASEEVLQPLAETNDLEERIDYLSTQALDELKSDAYSADDLEMRHVFLYLRLQGQEHSLEIDWEKDADIEKLYRQEYEKLYGHYIEDREIELASIKVIASLKPGEVDKAGIPENTHQPEALRQQKAWVENEWQKVPVYDIDQLKPGAEITGPAIVLYPTSTAFIEKGWQAVLDENFTLIAEQNDSTGELSEQPEEIRLELFSNRFTGIAEEMGALLQRTAFSVNVKERLDFSCALLDPKGDLIVNAPHIPVHLGALGVCVKQLAKSIKMEEGDVVITNSPAFGGSHLPDVTLVMPIFFEGTLVGYAANRAHHAEIGGISPGSMPADASRLAQEGVVINPTYLVKHGEPQWAEIKTLLTESKYPTRALQENLADLNAALASLERGKKNLLELFEEHGTETVGHYMQELKSYANKSLWRALAKFGKSEFSAEEELDGGSKLKVKISLGDKLKFDFSGTSGVHPKNLNANRAIVTSVTLYVLRLIADEEIPLNEGLLEKVEIYLPDNCMLNPDFPDDPEDCPAVVGGNVEVSQRLTDTLLKAFELAACSQGTMNNVLFGNENFGFYETICGGTGAGEGFDGADAVHQHMTNTRITDPEIMELRYPVRVQRFEIRRNSGGQGEWKGGDGVIRELEFREPVTLTVLTQHRKNQPYGLKGGEAGKAGRQFIIRESGEEKELDFIETTELKKGERFVIETPGGGGYGPSKS